MDTSAPIGFLAGFQHCIHTSSYWLSFAIVMGICGILWAITEFWYGKKVGDPQKIEIVLAVITIFAFFLCLLMRPCEVGWNTSVDMAAKGLYLGY